MNPLDLIPVIVGFGVAGIFLAALVEKIVPVVPSYVLLLMLGTVATGPASVVTTVLAAAAGSLCATYLWYALGRMLGEERVRRAVGRYGRYVFLKPATYESLAQSYRRNRWAVTFIGQTVPVARIYLALPAGVLRLERRSFLTAAGAGILLYNSSFIGIGFALRKATHDPVTVGLWLSVALVASEFLVGYLIQRLQRRRRSAL